MHVAPRGFLAAEFLCEPWCRQGCPPEQLLLSACDRLLPVLVLLSFSCFLWEGSGEFTVVMEQLWPGLPSSRAKSAHWGPPDGPPQRARIFSPKNPFSLSKQAGRTLCFVVLGGSGEGFGQVGGSVNWGAMCACCPPSVCSTQQRVSPCSACPSAVLQLLMLCQKCRAGWKCASNYQSACFLSKKKPQPSAYIDLSNSPSVFGTAVASALIREGKAPTHALPMGLFGAFSSTNGPRSGMGTPGACAVGAELM